MLDYLETSKQTGKVTPFFLGKSTGAPRGRSELTTELARQAEKAARKGEQRNVYKITRMIYWKYSSSRNFPLRDKQGHLLTFQRDQEAREVENVEEVLKRPEEEDTEIPDAEETLNIESGTWW